MYISKKKRTADPSAVTGMRADAVESAELFSESTSGSEDTGEGIALEREMYMTPKKENEAEYTAVEDDPETLDSGYKEAEMSYAEFLASNTELGMLRVVANAGSVSIPLSDVLVTVYKDLSDGRHIFYTVTTNADGSTENLPLPTPPRENSIDGNGKPPYSSYTVSATRRGLASETVEHVPIFSGIISVQPVTLTRLTEEA